MCYHFVVRPDHAMYKDQMALVCPHSFTPLDGRLGYDFVANEDAHRYRSVDLFDSPYFPSPTRLGLATRHLNHPFYICQLVERRKTLAIIICIFADASEIFGFDPSLPPIQRIRELLDKPTYNRFERHILNIARYALPN